MNLRFWRFFMYVVLGLCIVASSSIVYGAEQRSQEAFHTFTTKTVSLKQSTAVLKSLSTLRKNLSTYSDQGIDTSDAESKLHQVQDLVQQGEFEAATTLITTTEGSLDKALADNKAAAAQAAALQAQQAEAAQQQAAEEEKNRGDIKGVIGSSSAPLAGAAVTLVLANETLATVTTDSQGVYDFHFSAGAYTVAAAKSGYVKNSKEGVIIQAGQSTTLNLILTKIAPTPIPISAATNSADSTAHSNYRQLPVGTELGSFTVNLLTIDLSTGHVKVIADTAADGDCTNNCPVKAVKDFVTPYNGFAGINGSYFCPAAYADCVGKTNSFYWKVFNSRLQLMINQSNGLGEDSPFYAFDSTGKARFYSSWSKFSGSGFPIYAGISCSPILINNGANILDVSTLDDKQRTTKSIRTGLGLKGQTLYIAVVNDATVIDLASVMHYFGVDSALNLDGGGSSTLYYNNSYKTGPGRAVPNALIFAEN